MPACALSVTLIRATPEPEGIAALGARLCYSAKSLEDLDGMDGQAERDILRGVVGAGHLSVLEHASFTFGIEGVSRAFLAQVTRHRIASFSVQSQRYVSMEKGFAYVIPPSIRALGDEAVAEFEGQMAAMHGWYKGWQARLGGGGEAANQDARFVLPNACESRMILTMNARELLHFFALRCCRRAQWEIRAVAEAMLEQASAVAPALFETAGPPCVVGDCPEGKRSCGRADEVREHIWFIKKG